MKADPSLVSLETASSQSHLPVIKLHLYCIVNTLEPTRLFSSERWNSVALLDFTFWQSLSVTVGDFAVHNRYMQMQLAMAGERITRGRDEHMRDGCNPGESHLPLLIIILMPNILESQRN